VLFAIHLGSRRVHVLGVTRNPRLGMGHAAGPQPCGGGAVRRDPLRDQGPGRQVRRSLRRGVPL
jgi:hypothetical protein